MLLPMSYVGADARRLDDLRSAVLVAVDEVALRRRRVAALFAEAGEIDVVTPPLAALEAKVGAAACQIGAAATTAAADAAAGGQQGWRADLGSVDDVLLDVLWVNDLSRVFTGRDINTGTRVGIGGRVVSGVFLIPFTKLAKGTKLLKLGDDVVKKGTQAAGRSASSAVKNADEVRATLLALEQGKSRTGKVRVVERVSDIDALFDGLTEHAADFSRGRPWPTRRLDDGTTVARRPHSASGGPTLDITTPDRVEWKVHVSPWPPK